MLVVGDVAGTRGQLGILQANKGDGKAPLGLLWPFVMRMLLPNSGARRRRRGEAVPTLQREGIDLLALLPEREGGNVSTTQLFFSQLRVSLFGPGLYLATRHDQASGRCGPGSTEKQMRRSRRKM